MQTLERGPTPDEACPRHGWVVFPHDDEQRRRRAGLTSRPWEGPAGSGGCPPGDPQSTCCCETPRWKCSPLLPGQWTRLPAHHFCCVPLGDILRSKEERDLTPAAQCSGDRRPRGAQGTGCPRHPCAREQCGADRGGCLRPCRAPVDRPRGQALGFPWEISEPVKGKDNTRTFWRIPYHERGLLSATGLLSQVSLSQQFQNISWI